MPYATWTNEDVKKYQEYSSKIKSKFVGALNIGGIYKKSDPYKSRTVKASIFRIYDGNNNCPDRNLMKTDPKQGIKVEGGKVKGLVVLIEKDSVTGDFFNIVNRPQRTTAGAAWIAANYKGGAGVVADQIMKEHQGSLHEGCFTVNEQGVRGPVLNSSHIRTIILPIASKTFERNIASEDMGVTSYYDSALAQDGEQDLVVSDSFQLDSESLQGLLGEEFSAEDATISFVPAEGENGGAEQENATQEKPFSAYLDILKRITDTKTASSATTETPVAPVGPNQ